MKFWSVILLFLLPLCSFAGTFKVMWWNIGGGNYYDYPVGHENCYSDQGRNLELLQKNILDKANEWNSPDVMIFGESYDGFLKPETVSKLLERYPYQLEFAYNHNTQRPLRMFVYSKREPIQSAYVSEGLRWNNFHDDPFDQSNYIRSYQRITFLVGGRKINVVPLHAIDPWPEMRAKVGLIRMGLNLLFSDQHSNSIQATYFQKLLSQDRI